MATELRASQSVIRLQQRYRNTGKVTETHRSGRPLATSHTDGCFFVNNALGNRMMKNATQLQAHLRELRDTSDRSKPFISACNAYWTTFVGTWPYHHTQTSWTRDQQTRFCSLVKVDLRREEMIAVNNVGDVKEAPCLSHWCHQTNLWWWSCLSLGRSVQSRSLQP